MQGCGLRATGFGPRNRTDRSDPNDLPSEAVKYEGLEPLALQAEGALAALRGEPSGIASGVDGMRAVAVAEQAALRLVAVSAAE